MNFFFFTLFSFTTYMHEVLHSSRDKDRSVPEWPSHDIHGKQLATN